MTGGEGGRRNDSSRSGAACETEDDGGQQRQQFADAMQWRLQRRLGCADVAARRCNDDSVQRRSSNAATYQGIDGGSSRGGSA
ncbi:hypothetical protein Syun_023565 [Stephania yunnanensis]|uniref:Uncharacterized protein n=1 Tax=Stephania yunnanensis TaxID=152371 RepID=A0AAP0F9W0_9MAGN